MTPLRSHIATQAALRACEIIRAGKSRLHLIDQSEKAPGDIATEIDLAAERAIFSLIQQTFPNDAFVGEETGDTATHRDAKNSYQWIVDPLDGTFNFVHGYPHCAVSIALANEGDIVLSVIANPFNGELFFAEKGQGATLNGAPLAVNRRTQLRDALVGVVLPGGGHQSFSRVWGYVERVARASGQIRRSGSAALDLAYVAAGRLDGFFVMSLRKWDIAAGALLVTEAGGVVCDLRGGMDNLATEQCVAGNVSLVPQIVQALNYTP